MSSIKTYLKWILFTTQSNNARQLIRKKKNISHISHIK